MSYFGEPLFLVVSVGFPLLTSMGMALLYRSSGGSNLSGFAVLGGVMLAFWSNVLWSMASQFHWDKQEGLFEIYLVSPAPITAILVGMSLGGIAGTAPAATIVTILGWLFFSPPINPSWPTVAVVFMLTIASLYAMGMLMSSLYLVYGREAESLNDAMGEPISMLSGIYFPSIGRTSPLPFAIQAIASLIPLTVGMDALRRAMFSSEDVSAVYQSLAVLAVMAGILLVAARWALRALEERGRRLGSLAVRLK
jgi:ABC-2 type transport system permease protein